MRSSAAALVTDPGALAILARDARLGEARLEIGRPIAYMLATPLETIATPIDPQAFVVEDKIDGIRALGAPSGDQATVTNMLNLAQADLNKVKSNPTLLAGNTNPFADFAKVAHPYGLTACAPNA